MSRRIALHLALCAGLMAAPFAIAATPPKPAAKAANPAAKPAPKAAPRAGFDARDPAAMIGVLAEMGAKAEVSRSTQEEVFLKVTTPAFAFNMQYVGCDRTGRACRAIAFATVAEQRRANISQLNAFNQTSLTCRVFQDQAAKPHVMYSTLVSAADTREEMRAHVGVWQGCLAAFGAFLNDPPGYLATAP
jgi:hypothetical protein